MNRRGGIAVQRAAGLPKYRKQIIIFGRFNSRASVVFRRRRFRLNWIKLFEQLNRHAGRWLISSASDRSKRNPKDWRDSMKKFLLGTVGLVALGLAGPASAADIAARPYTKAPPPIIPPIYDWSGFYIGFNGGGGSSRNCWDLVTTPAGIPLSPFVSEGCHNSTGGTAGGQIGYRWQVTNWVFGLEAQGNWANFRGDNVSLVFPTDINRSRIDAFGLFTGQIGYAWNNVLFYVKGGGAVTADKHDIFDIPTGLLISNVNETRWGGTVGAGFEYGFAPNWSVGVEYDHLFMGNRNVSFATPAGLFDGTDRIREDVDMGLVRVNYRFGGPAIARY
jgi:outer membrane immunogenic protein